MSTTLPFSIQHISHQANTAINEHWHQQAQLLVVLHGTASLLINGERWLVLERQGIWIDKNIAHSVTYGKHSDMLLLLFSVADCEVPGKPFYFSNLLLELLQEALRVYDSADASQALMLIHPLILYCVTHSQHDGQLHLLGGSDRRLTRAIAYLNQQPGIWLNLVELANHAGCSAKTLSRLFTAETGISFIQWREKFSIMTAMERLAQGQSVSQVALDLGYQSVGNFSTMFSRVMKIPPGKFTVTAAKGYIAATDH